ncbi:MAG: hypothetical protein Q8R29_02455 [bacterium]|nr:hypothetical protein [bacterium]
MDSELEKEWEKSYKRRVKKRHRERLKKVIAVLIGLVLAIVVFIGFDCLKKGERLISRERTLSSEEWSYYASLKNKAKELEIQQMPIKVYERLLEKFRRGELQGYTQNDSLVWVRSSLELKRKFNKALHDSKYNSIMGLVPKFADSDYLPESKEFTPLPPSFMPYVLSEGELQEVMQNPREWVAEPDSSEQK